MPATIKFYGNVLDTDEQDVLDHTAGSGIGFFGNAFGVPVALGDSQSSTWVTTEDGSGKGRQLNNNEYVTEGTSTTPGTALINGQGPINLNKIPNYLSTLNIRFEHDVAVIASQPKIYIWDRQSITNHAVDVITYVYEVRHPTPIEDDPNLSHRASTATNVWTVFEDDQGEPQAMPLTNSPGPSGLNTSVADATQGTAFHSYLTNTLGLDPADYNNGSTGEYLRHDWYVAISSSPTDIGQKTEYGLYFTVDYL